MSRYSKAQLNAISRSYTIRDQKRAVEKLLDDFNVDYVQFRYITKYKASPVRLIRDLTDKVPASIERLKDYYELTNRGEVLWNNDIVMNK